MIILMFTWDELKREKVIRDHNVDFKKIIDIFEDSFAIDFEDYEHSTEGEIRYGKIGLTAEYGLIVLFYSYKNEDARFITARRAEKWMVKVYEQQRY